MQLTLFTSLAKNISTRSGRKSRLQTGRQAADTLAGEARKSGTMLTSSGIINTNKSKHVVSAFSKRGSKVNNQDRLVVWEEFGCQEDMMFCGIFDGHGPWGHLVAKTVRELMPSMLLSNWQETVSQLVLQDDGETDPDGCYCQFNLWKQSYLKTCSAIDHDLGQLPGIDSFYSGSTALTIVQQGDLLVIANIGDSRAVLATTSDEGSLVPVQLTVDLKPNLPQESQRITQSKGRICSSNDEPGVYRVWMPSTLDGPGLSISRAFGDHLMKPFGLISEPELTQRRISRKDQFVIFATDGVWDVISNQEAIKIVASTPKREESAKRLVESAVCAWKRKRPGIAVDDVSAICLFLHCS